MKSSEDAEINSLLHHLYDEDQEIRIKAINRLGEIGDELCLKELRQRLKELSPEHQALIIAIGKLKNEFGVNLDDRQIVHALQLNIIAIHVEGFSKITCLKTQFSQQLHPMLK